MKKIILSLILSFTLIIPQVAAAEGEGFSDIDNSHPNYSAIMYLKNRKIIKGYDDGSFQPNREITRAELLKIGLLSNSDIQIDLSQKTDEFKDVSGDDWVNPFVAKAKSIKAVKGTESGNFEPNRTISKVELLKILYTIYGIGPGSGTNEFAPKDIRPESWKYPYIDYALQHGFVGLDNNFNSGGDSPATRAFTADIIYRLQLLKHGGDTQSRLMKSEARLIEGLKLLNGKRYEEALKWIDPAVDMTDTSKFDLEKPEYEKTVKAAYKIAKAFQVVANAGEKTLKDKDANIKSDINVSLILAIDAIVLNPNKTMLALANQIKIISFNLLGL